MIHDGNVHHRELRTLHCPLASPTQPSPVEAADTAHDWRLSGREELHSSCRHVTMQDGHNTDGRDNNWPTFSQLVQYQNQSPHSPDGWGAVGVGLHAESVAARV